MNGYQPEPNYVASIDPTPFGWNWQVCVADHRLPDGVTADCLTGWCFGSRRRARRVANRVMDRMNKRIERAA